MAEKQNIENSKESLADRLSAFIDKTRLKRPQLAARLDVPYDRLSSYIQGRAEPPSDFWKKLQVEFPEADVGLIITGVPGLAISEYVSETDLEKIPIVGTINAGSLGIGFRDEDVIDWVWTTKIKDPKAFGLIVHGDSMLQQIHNGDYVLCAPSRPFINGKVYAVV
ncbi:MAG: S24 family peptidase, partial [Ignavibacteriota bacterium]